MPNDFRSEGMSQDLTECLEKALNLIAYNSIDQSIIKIPQMPKSSNRHLLIALSGGADSTALLLALSEIASSFNFQLTACHINHGLRGDESEQDAQFCQKLCNRLNIECEIIKLTNIKPSSHTLDPDNTVHINEATLREKRYEQLVSFATKEKISLLLTAHTLDDQIETLMFRLLRGTGPAGLRGIEFCRRLTDNLYLLRPLLKHHKAQCQNYLTSQGIMPRQDSSNSNEIYTRNYIRHNIFPSISKRFPDFSIHMDCLREIISAEDDYLENISRELFEQLQSGDPQTWSVDIFAGSPLALQRRVLGHALKARGVEISFKRLDEIASLAKNQPNKVNCLNLNKNWRVRRFGDELLWQEVKERSNNNPNPLLDPLEIIVPGLNPIPELNLSLLVETYQESQSAQASFDRTSFPEANSNTIFADLSLVKPPLVIRQRQPGDKINPLGMTQAVRLKKYIHTHKTSSKDNHFNYFAVLLADQDEVLWLPGLGISEKIKVRNIPSHVLSWQKVQ